MHGMKEKLMLGKSVSILVSDSVWGSIRSPAYWSIRRLVDSCEEDSVQSSVWEPIDNSMLWRIRL